MWVTFFPAELIGQIAFIHTKKEHTIWLQDVEYGNIVVNLRVLDHFIELLSFYRIHLIIFFCIDDNHLNLHTQSWNLTKNSIFPDKLYFIAYVFDWIRFLHDFRFWRLKYIQKKYEPIPARGFFFLFWFLLI